MPSTETAVRTTEIATEDVREFGRQVEAALRRAKERIKGEIHAYPPPIPACDAQFNYLLEQRNAAAAELGAVRSACASGDTAAVQAAALIQLVTASTVLKPDVKQWLLALSTSSTRGAH
jgi:hypothetical protein